MLRSRVSLVALVTGTTILASACSDTTTQPTAPADQSPTSPDLRTAQQPAADPNALARSVPGFGGFFIDEQGTPTIYLKDAAQRGNAGRALGAWLQARGLDASAIRVLKGDFDWADLEQWQVRASEQVLGVAGAVFVDADEASNRVRIGVERGATGGQARAAAARLGIPASAVIVQETDPILPVATLQQRVRPIIAGVQINFPGFLCSVGFNAVQNGQNSFVTASHCTTKQGGVENTPYWQPLQTIDPDTVGVEVADPVYQRNLSGCPKGRVCRYSDAARARYTTKASVTFSLGRIARTSGPNNGSLAITDTFRITSADPAAIVGETVNKVGRTTGWTQGKVTNTCVNTGVSGTKIVQLCQTFVSAGVGAGDSGSDVFGILSGGGVKLLGILWGGNSNGTQFVYSPLANIERATELGSLQVF
jgi:hypothetical protein